MHKGGGGFNHPHNPLRLAMCAINHALLLLPFLTPSQLLLLNLKVFVPRAFCSTFAAYSTLCYFILTHCKSRPFFFYSITSCHCATPFTPLHLQVGVRPTLQLPLHTIIFTHYCPPFYSCVISLQYSCLQFSKYHTFKNVTNFFPTPHPPT